MSIFPQLKFRSSKRDVDFILQRARTLQSKSERIRWLEDLMAWVRSDVPISSRVIEPYSRPKELRNHLGELPPSDTISNSHQAVRIRYLLLILHKQPDLRLAVSSNLKHIFLETSATELFCDAGIFGDPGLLLQINSILIEKLLPTSGSSEEFGHLINVLFPTESDSDWVDILAPDLVQEIISLVEHSGGADPWSELHHSFADAMLIIASQVAGAGADRSMRERLTKTDFSTSAFIRLLEMARLLHQKLVAESSFANIPAKDLEDFLNAISDCQELVAQALAHIEIHGVSINLVFRFERIALLLKRLTFMTSFLNAAIQGQANRKVSRLLAELIRSSLDGHSLRRLFSGEIRLLSRRIVDHASHSGDHYITYDRAGYWRMFFSAAGGGIVTVGCIVMKGLVHVLHLPSLIEGLVNWTNYSGGFVFMQLCRFTLATKQPSMTASTLAKRMANFATSSGSQNIVFTVRDAFRSQFIAGVGNVFLALPTSIAFAWLYHYFTGRYIFDENYALKSIQSLDPFHSLTIPFAILTGFFLWLASVLSGAFENWISLHKISERIVTHRKLKYFMSAKKIKYLSEGFKKNAAAFSGSVFLGFFLAFTPFLGRITGIPFDVRHVTFSTGTLGLSFVSLQDPITQSMVISASLGVLTIGLMNFGVSFFLALFVASRAQNVRRGLLLLLARKVGKEFLKSPLAFFWPPKSSAISAKADHPKP